VLKHKSLVIVSILVLVLAVVAMACAPATPPKPVTPPVVTPPVTPPVAPPVVVKPTSFESAVYTNDTYGFSVKYPKAWEIGKASLPTSVFYAHGGDDMVYIDVRPATNFKDASVALLADLIKAKGLIVTPNVDLDKAATLADGKTAANEVLLSASVLFQTKNGYCFGLIKDGKAIIVMTGLDPKKLDLFKEIAQTLTLK